MEGDKWTSNGNSCCHQVIFNIYFKPVYYVAVILNHYFYFVLWTVTANRQNNKHGIKKLTSHLWSIQRLHYKGTDATEPLFSWNNITAGFMHKYALPTHEYKKQLSTIWNFRLALFRKEWIFRKTSSCLYVALTIFQGALLLESE